MTPDDAGNSPYPTQYVVNPYAGGKDLEWTTEDWDPALRFWTLGFDRFLGEWLRSVDTSRPSILAAQEFATQEDIWNPVDPSDPFILVTRNWLEVDDLGWLKSKLGFARIQQEITQLQQLMQDDRERYLAEIEAQADGLANYIIAFIGASQDRHPWTIELINCGLAIGNVAYMRWKSRFKRVRPSFLCPGLAPPFGPPGHPAFPSGHSTLGHFIALLLLELPNVQERYGLFADGTVARGEAVKLADLAGTGPIKSALMWLGARLAKNRERLGVHYPSDSAAGRHLGAALWDSLVAGKSHTKIDCPTLDLVLSRARAEWPSSK